MTDVVDWIEKHLGYRFRDRGRLERALTHRSAGGPHNERLEFLGDAVLGLLIAEVLHRALPAAREGDLTRLRASLVRRETLAELAAAAGLGEQVRLGAGELRSGGFRRDSILANALEAVVGAAYLDGGLDAARGMVRVLFGDRLERLPPPDSLKDPKTRLQERLQGRGLDVPVYDIVEISGEPHRQRFTASCVVAGLDLETRGEGRSRRAAEQAAARSMLERLQDE